MTGLVELSFESRLAVTPAEAWAWVTSLDGVSRELWPYLRMSAPRGVVRLDDVEVVPGRPLFRSWVFLFGLLPVDRLDLTLLSLRPHEGFVEQSPALLMRLWRHERHIEPVPGGCRLRDRLCFQPRWAAGLVRWFMHRVFSHRHAVLRRRFGNLA